MRFVVRLLGVEVFSAQLGRSPVTVQDVLDQLADVDDEQIEEPEYQDDLPVRYEFGFGHGA